MTSAALSQSLAPVKDWQGRAGVAGDGDTGGQVTLAEGGGRARPVGSTAGRRAGRMEAAMARWHTREQDPQSVATAGVTLVHTRAVMLIQVCAHWHRAHMHAHTRTPTLSHALGSRQPLPAGEALRPRTAVTGTALGGGTGGQSGHGRGSGPRGSGSPSR